MLEIKAMDYDMLFGDDLIGSTIIDLEDRYFLPEWNAIKDKPVEFRCLHCPASAVAQGVLKMWVEIISTKLPDDEKPMVWDISAKPPETFEVRVCIFDGEDIIMMDSEGTCDAFYRCFFDNKDSLDTDTHFRNQDGRPSFNWRLIYKITHPRKHYLFTVQCWDLDFFSPNEIVGSYEIDLR
jgi:Ca2+-dependent lipid-binding protein